MARIFFLQHLLLIFQSLWHFSLISFQFIFHFIFFSAHVQKQPKFLSTPFLFHVSIYLSNFLSMDVWTQFTSESGFLSLYINRVRWSSVKKQKLVSKNTKPDGKRPRTKTKNSSLTWWCNFSFVFKFDPYLYGIYLYTKLCEFCALNTLMPACTVLLNQPPTCWCLKHMSEKNEYMTTHFCCTFFIIQIYPAILCMRGSIAGGQSMMNGNILPFPTILHFCFFLFCSLLYTSFMPSFSIASLRFTTKLISYKSVNLQLFPRLWYVNGKP